MKKQKIKDIIFCVIYIGLPALFLISLIALEIYVWFKYGNMSMGEVPAWANWVMLRGRG